MLKRWISSFIGISILAALLIINNKLLFNIVVAAISIIGLQEFYSAMKQKDIQPISIIGYIVSLGLIGIGFISKDYLRIALALILPVILFIGFCRSILTNIKINVVDISVTILGIIYVVYLFSFVIYTKQMFRGDYYIWYILAGAWMTDTFAFLVGITIGKHKFSKISPKKSIEGCIGGIIGCVAFYLGYTYYLNTIGIEMNYITMTILAFIVSIIAQIGDFAASSIKRYCNIKDFGTIMPGHGGILDRFDSMLFVAPIIYTFFSFL